MASDYGEIIRRTKQSVTIDMGDGNRVKVAYKRHRGQLRVTVSTWNSCTSGPILSDHHDYPTDGTFYGIDQYLRIARQFAGEDAVIFQTGSVTPTGGEI